MKLGIVTGSVVATVKHPVYEGHRLLLLHPADPKGNIIGKAIVGVDMAQAGPGDKVLYVDEGNSARKALGDTAAPVRVVIVGIVDAVEVE